MLGTEGYFDHLKNLSGEALTENSGYIIIAGVVCGLVFKIFEDRAETFSQKRFGKDYAAIKEALPSQQTANLTTSAVDTENLSTDAKLTKQNKCLLSYFFSQPGFIPAAISSKNQPFGSLKAGSLYDYQ